jgi:CheY-like chemotaxis protein
MKTPTAMVFVIDDDQSVRKSLRRLLDAANYDTEVFNSASEFLSRLPNPGPSCIVIDVRMPGRNGIDFQNVLIENNRAEHLIFTRSSPQRIPSHDLCKTANGKIASTEKMKCSVCASWFSFSAASAIGTNTGSQSSGFRRIS